MTADPAGGVPLPPSPGYPAGSVPAVPGQVPLLEVLATCVHPDGSHHLAGYDRDGFAITCDRWRLRGARLRYWVVDPRHRDIPV